MMPTHEGSSSVARAFDLLSIVTGAGPEGISLMDLARAAKIPVSTCHRYVSSLLALTVLDRDARKRLVLGVGLLTLAGRYLEDDVVRAVARPSLLRMSEASGHTVHLGTFARDIVVYVDKVESGGSVRLRSHIGKKLLLHCSAMGKAILASLPEPHRERIVSRAVSRPTARTLLGDDLRREVDRIRDGGWAVDEQENEEGVRCVGVAIRSAAGDPIGGLSISGPVDRISHADCERLALQAMAAAAEIEQQLCERPTWPRWAAVAVEGALP